MCFLSWLLLAISGLNTVLLLNLHRRTVKPVDLRKLDEITRHYRHLVDQYQTLTTPSHAKETAMSTPDPQGNIDADVAALQSAFTSLASIFTDLQSELAAIPAEVDTTALDALVGQGQSLVSQYQSIDTTTPPTTPPAS